MALKAAEVNQLKQAKEFVFGQAGLLQNAVLEEAGRDIAAVDRDRDAQLGTQAMQQPGVATRLVVNINASTFQYGNHLLGFEDR
jgi:hypothetical protein